MSRSLLLVAAPNRATRAPSGTPTIGGGRGVLEVRMFDVGDGEAILIVFPGKTAWLVDGGRTGLDQPNQDLGDALAAYLRKRDLRLKALVATHPHKDHLGALTTLVPLLPAGSLTYYYTGGAAEFPRTWLQDLERALRSWDRKGARHKVHWKKMRNRDEHVRVGDKAEAHLFAGDRAGEYTSVMLHLRFGEARLLFTGDVLAAYEKRLLKAYPADHFRADVLKVTHHGASSGTSPAFVQAVQPGIVIASTAADHGHTLEPDVWNSPKGKARLGPPMKKFETLEDGDIVLKTKGELKAGGVLYRIDTSRPGLLT